MKIGTKLGGGYLLVLGMVLVCSAAGFYGVNRLSGLLDFITGPAWDTADGAMEGSIGIEAEMIGMGQIVAGQSDMSGAQQMLEEGSEMAEEALGRMVAAGLMSGEEVELLGEQKAAFRLAQEQLLQAFNEFQQADGRLRDDFNDFQGLMTEAEELGDSAVEELESNPDLLMSWNAGLSEKWSAADGAMESQIELLTRFYNYQRLVSLMNVDEVEEERSITTALKNALNDLNEKAGEIRAHPLFKRQRVGSGPYSGKSYADAIGAAIQTHQSDFKEGASSFRTFRDATATYNEVAAQLLSTVEVIEEAGDAKVEAQAGTIATTKRLTFILIILAMALGVASTLAIMYFVVRTIVTTIKEMSVTSQQIADGDLTVMLSSSALQEGGDELAMLNSNMSRMTSKLRETIGEVATTSSMLASQAEELSAVAKETTDGIMEQQAKTSSAASAITEMSASSKEVATNTLEARDSAQQAQIQAQNGQKVVSETISAINALTGDVTSTAQVISRLIEDSEKIGSVLVVIQNIADQTNLLALNAAIEAARAGDQGRGFAVVADEVRTLAKRTQESTQEIQEVILGLQERTRDAGLAMESSQLKAQDSTEKAQQAGESLQIINQEVMAIAERNAQIAAAMTQQEAAAEEISQSVVDIETTSQQTVSAANQTTESSQEVAHQAANLQTVVSYFKI